MSKLHFWQYIVDDTGVPLENVNVRIYLSDDPNTLANIFTHQTTGSSTTTLEALSTTDGDGFFECWFGDYLEGSGGYSADQRFKITWERAGLDDGYIDGIDIFPNFYEVDELDSVSVTKNKLISNQMAYEWETHKNASALSVHGMEAVVVSGSDTTYNKLVSNSLMNHIWSVVTSAGAMSISASAAAVREFDVTIWAPSSDIYYADLDHFLNRQYPVVILYKASNGEQIQPLNIESISVSRIRIWMPEEVSLKVTIVG